VNNLSKIDFVILCGGLGKRLRSVTGDAPKVLAEVNGKPFLNVLIDYIAAQGGKRFILCTGYGADVIEAYFKKTFQHLDIVFSREESPLGTGGAIKKGASLVQSEHFIAMNGDCFCTLEYKDLAKFHESHKAVATIAVNKVLESGDFGTIEFDHNNRILAFKEKIASGKSAYVNTGTYCLNKNIFSSVKTSEQFSIEYDFFPKLIGEEFFAYMAKGEFIDIGTPERYNQVQQFLRKAGIHGA